MKFQEKTDYLTSLMVERQYSQDEINHVISLINPDWLTQEQEPDEIKAQFGVAYELWRGLGSALLTYLDCCDKINNS